MNSSDYLTDKCSSLRDVASRTFGSSTSGSGGLAAHPRRRSPRGSTSSDPTRLAGFLGYSQLVADRTADTVVGLRARPTRRSCR